MILAVRRKLPLKLTIYGASMLLNMMKCKIHRATISDRNLNYEGSIEIDSDLMEAAGLLPYEQVQVLNLNNAQRFITYAIKAPAGSGRIALAGPAVRLGEVGDLVIIISYAQIDDNDAKNYKPKVVQVDNKNRIVNK